MNTGGKSPVFLPVGGESETARILSLMGGGAVIQGQKSAETNTFQNRRKEVSNMAVFRIEKTRDYTVMPCPHNEITIVQRSQQQSAVAAAAGELTLPAATCTFIVL